jgi:hypothetical protein
MQMSLSDKQIIEKAIVKAFKPTTVHDIVISVNNKDIVFNKFGHIVNLTAYEIIFSHDFAKAFWGEEIVRDTIWFDGVEADDRSMPAWQYHLQEMVLWEEPLKYLEKFL